MKKLFSTFIAAAAVISFGLLPGMAQAGIFANVTPAVGPPAATFATEIFGTGSSATPIPTAPFASAVYTMASGPASDFLITYTLNQGATWGTALTSGSLLHGGTGTATCALTDGGLATDSTAEFRVTVTAAVTVADTFTLTYDINDADPLATAGTDINLAIALTDNLGNVDSAENVDIFDSADGTTETVTASVAAGTCYIDVSTSNTNFGGTSADVISATEVILGSVGLADSGVAFEDDGTTVWTANIGDAGNTVTLTVTGDFSASLGVDKDSDATTADGVYLDLNWNGTYNAGEEADTLTATTATWNLGATASFAADVHMVVDGTTAIVEQTPSAILTVDWTTATYADDSETNDFRELTKNGTTRNVYNIPGSANSDQAYIRIYNTSSLVGTVRGTLFDQSGSLGTAVLVSDMAAGSTQIFSAADLETLFGTWTGRARMTIDGEISSMEVMGLIRSATGTITNMSSVAP